MVETANHRSQDMGHFQEFFSLISLRTVDSSHHCSKRGMHGGGTKFLRCTATPTRRATRGDRQLEYYRPGNSDAYLRAGRTGTSQFSLYQFQPSSYGTIGTDDCDNEVHSIPAQEIVINNNKLNKDQEKILLLELWGGFYSWN